MREVKLLQEAKAHIRREVLARRDALDAAYRATASAAICARLTAHDDVETARTLLAFAPFGSEVALDPLLQQIIDRGSGLFLPFVRRLKPPDLGIARVSDLQTDLVTSDKGIREPDPQRRRSARIDRIDVVLAPCVAVDPLGRRLGYGAALYDHLLPQLRPGTPVIAVAFETQVVDELPETIHDMRVDWIATEDRLIQAGAERDNGL
jgi:5-formyltetrahydrofolate cyclo-ligase